MRFLYTIILITGFIKFSSAQMSVSAIVNHIDPTKSQDQGSIYVNVTNGVEPYNYEWPLNNSTSNEIKYLTVGSYTINVIAADNEIVSKSYDIGYKALWGGLKNTELTKDSLSNYNSNWGTALSKNVLPNDSNGWIENVISDLEPGNSIFGFVDSAAIINENVYDIKFGFYIQSNQLYSIVEGDYEFISICEIGDVLKIERVDNDLFFYVNGIRVNQCQDSQKKSLRIKAALSNNSIKSLGCSFTPKACNITVDAGHEKTVNCKNPTVTLNGSSNVTNPLYLWTPHGADSTSINNITSIEGIHHLKVTDLVNGCVSTATVLVIKNVNYPIISAGPNKILYDSIPSVVLNGFSNTSNITFTWTPQGTTPSSLSNIVTSVGVYTLTVKDTLNGCLSKSTVRVYNKFSLNETIKNYSNDSLMGSVNFLISGGVSPYNISWNGNKIPSSSTIYKYLKDSLLNNTIDSLSIIKYIDSLKQVPNYTNMLPGTYSVTVYDSFLDSISSILKISENISNWSYSQGVDIDTSIINKRYFNNKMYNYGIGNKISQSGSYIPNNHFAIPFSIVDLNVNNELSFSIPKSTDVCFVGLQDNKSEINGNSVDISKKTMFKFNGNSIFEIIFNDESIYSSGFSSGDLFSFKTNPLDTSISYYKNETFLVARKYNSINNVPYFLPKIILGSSGAIIKDLKIIKDLTSAPSKNISNIRGNITDVTCFNPCSGSINVDGYIFLGTPISFEIYPLGSSVPIQTVSLVNSSTTIFNNLCSGKYNVIYKASYTPMHLTGVNVSSSINTVSQIFEVAYKPNWESSTYNVFVNPTDNSISKTSGSTINWVSGSSSLNSLSASDNGWIEWTGSRANGIYGVGFSTVDINQNINTINYGIGVIEYLNFYINIRNQNIFSAMSSTNFSGSYRNVSDVFRLEKTSSSVINFKINDRPVATFPITNQKLILDVSLLLMNSTVKHPRVSFGCDAQSYYAEFKRKLDATYYRLNSGVLNFKFDEEYVNNGSALEFKIYDKNRNIILSNLSISAQLNLSYKDNRYSLNLLQILPSLTSGYYIMEVKDKKGEIQMLRFKL